VEEVTVTVTLPVTVTAKAQPCHTQSPESQRWWAVSGKTDCLWRFWRVTFF